MSAEGDASRKPFRPAKTPQNYCVTKSKVTKINFKWTIKNFSSCYVNKVTDELFESPVFYSQEDPYSKWSLIIYSKSYRSDNTYKDLCYFLQYNSFEPCFAKYTLALLNEKVGDLIYEGTLFTGDCKNGRTQKLDFDILFGENGGYLVDDTLELNCEIEVFKTSEETSMSGQEAISRAENKSALSNDLIVLFQKQEFTDVELKCDGKIIHNHKNVLAAGSSVFSAMFKPGTLESETNVVNIIDVDYDVLNELVLFLYSRKTPSFFPEFLQRQAKLLIAADKYDVQGLKELCTISLVHKLSTENILDVSTVADSYSSSCLKKIVLDYVEQHMKSSEWRSRMQDSPRMITDVVRAFLKSFDE